MYIRGPSPPPTPHPKPPPPTVPECPCLPRLESVEQYPAGPRISHHIFARSQYRPLTPEQKWKSRGWARCWKSADSRIRSSSKAESFFINCFSFLFKWVCSPWRVPPWPWWAWLPRAPWSCPPPPAGQCPSPSPPHPTFKETFLYKFYFKQHQFCLILPFVNLFAGHSLVSRGVPTLFAIFLKCALQTLTDNLTWKSN